MKRWMTGFVLAAGLIALSPGLGAGQVGVRVDLYWQWGDGGWIPHRSAYVSPRIVYRNLGGVVYLPRREVVYRRPPRAIRVPPGHLPPPGLCRLWYPGRPPGQQPPPERCGHLFGHRHPGAVILGSPAYHEVHPGDRHRGHRGHKGRKGRRGRGHR